MDFSFRPYVPLSPMISTNAGYGGDCPVRPHSPAGARMRARRAEGRARAWGDVTVVGRNQGDQEDRRCSRGSLERESPSI